MADFTDDELDERTTSDEVEPDQGSDVRIDDDDTLTDDENPQ